VKFSKRLKREAVLRRVRTSTVKPSMEVQTKMPEEEEEWEEEEWEEEDWEEEEEW